MDTRADTRANSKLVNLYAAISVDTIRLFLPQNEIRSLEPAVEVNRVEPPMEGVGWIFFDGRDWPVYCLGSDLSPSDRLPAARRICVMLGVAQGYFGLMCDRLEVLSENRLQPVPLPAIMQSSHTPVQALALYEGTPGCVVSADALFGFLDFCASRPSPPAKSGYSN